MLKPKPVKHSFGYHLRTYLFAGLAAILPLAITIYILIILFKFADNLGGKYLNPFLLKTYGYKIPGIGLVATILLLIFVGFFSTRFIGREIFRFLERLFLKIPFVASIYPSLKQLSDFMFTLNRKELKKVVIVEYPYPGSYSIGFVTNEEVSFLGNGVTGRMISVYIPIVPSPFSGLLILLPQDRVRAIDITIEEAIRFIVSGGVVSPLKEIPGVSKI